MRTAGITTSNGSRSPHAAAILAQIPGSPATCRRDRRAPARAGAYFSSSFNAAELMRAGLARVGALASELRLRVLMAQYPVLAGRELRLPLRFGLLDLAHALSLRTGGILPEQAEGPVQSVDLGLVDPRREVAVE